ncbi:MAG: VOC family protein [Candidatus Cloacimonetes bacterium]|nr:VOC family protein [Candidatus Cloacimonadota bacterium]
MEVIRLLVDNFDDSFRFYSEKIGLKVIWGKPGDVYASFDTGNGREIGLFKTELMEAAISDSRSKSSNEHRDKIAIILNVDDVDENYRRIKETGVDFLNQPTNIAAWGMRVVHFRDNEGNLIELCSPLKNE